MNQKKIVCNLFIFLLTISMIVVTGEIKAQQDSSVEKTIERLRFIHVKLTDGGERKEKMIKRWLVNPNSGYPDLVKVLLDAVNCPQGGSS
jgi:hypothetical protein